MPISRGEGAFLYWGEPTLIKGGTPLGQQGYLAKGGYNMHSMGVGTYSSWGGAENVERGDVTQATGAPCQRGVQFGFQGGGNVFDLEGGEEIQGGYTAQATGTPLAKITLLWEFGGAFAMGAGATPETPPLHNGLRTPQRSTQTWQLH
jgi:hypothetical protein